MQISEKNVNKTKSVFVKPINSSKILPIYWGDGSIIFKGSWYNTDYNPGDGRLMKINLHDFSDNIVVDLKNDPYIKKQKIKVGSFLNFIIVKKGFLWVSDITINTQPHLYKVSFKDLTVQDSWEVFKSGIMEGTQAGCADDSYIYLGGNANDMVRFKFSDESIIRNESFKNVSIHCMVEDGKFIYAIDNNSKKMFKIFKDDLSLAKETSIPSGAYQSDNICHDKNYVYSFDEFGGSLPYGVNRWEKKDLSIDSLYKFPDDLGRYGSNMIIDKKLFILPATSAEKSKYKIEVIDLKTASLEKIITISKLEHPEYRCWNLMNDPEDSTYVYLSRQKNNAREMQLHQFDAKHFRSETGTSNTPG